MKTFKKITAYLLATLLFILGIISILLEELGYGMVLIIIALLIIPLTSSLLTKLSPKLFTRRNNILNGATISIVVLINLLTFGKQDSEMIEKITPKVLTELSIHPIKNTEVDGLNYYYIEKGEGETILLLHGFPDMANTWDETITELSKTNRVIAPFLRGYFPTNISKNDDYSVKSIAEDMMKLMDKLAINNFSVVGQDWGRSIGLSVTNLADERVQKFVSIAIPHPTCMQLTPELAYAGRHFLLLSNGDYGV